MAQAFLAALTLAHRFRAAAAILALAASLMVNFFGLVTAGVADTPFLALAQRAIWAALIRAIPAALILRGFRAGFSTTGAGGGGGVAAATGAPPSRAASSCSSAPIFSFRSAACLS